VIATGSQEQGWSVSSCGGIVEYGREGSTATMEDIRAEYGMGRVTEAASDADPSRQGPAGLVHDVVAAVVDSIREHLREDPDEGDDGT
jgi:hypothetical protein